MNEKQHLPEDFSFLDQLPGGYHPLAADLSSAGLGTWEDFQRRIVLLLQPRFQETMPGNDGGRDLPGATGESLLHHTLHGQLLNVFLVLAMALRPALDKWNLWTDTLRSLYR